MRRRVAAACLSVLLATGAHAQTLRIALNSDPDILDPTLSRTVNGRVVYAALCDKLFDIDPKLNIVPQLATGYEWSDPRTLVIHLRPGVKFHDGEVMDAQAVKFSLERHLTMQGSFRRSEINSIDHVEVVDPATVRIVLKAPSAPFLAQLTDRAGMILSPKAAEAAGKDFGLHPVCAGPFRFVERLPQDRIVLERFPDYWNAAAIHVAKLVYVPIPDSSVALGNLQSGAVDMVLDMLPTDVETVKKNPKLRLTMSDQLGYQGLTINVGNGPRADTPLGRDSRVRQAFALSLDLNALNDVVYNGLFTPNVQAVPKGSPFYLPAFTPPARDVAGAKTLLKEAGVTPPVSVDIMTPNTPDIRQVAEVIQSMAAEAGFDVKITATEFASSLQAANRGDFQAYLVQWSGRIDIDGNVYAFLHTGAGLNDGHYANAGFDSLLDAGRTEPDLEKRRAIYANAWKIEMNDLPIIYMWTRKNILGMRSGISGYTPVPDGLVRLQGVTVAP